MKKFWEAERIENRIGTGTPDVYYSINEKSAGWIELKHLHEWPKRGTTPVKIEHFTAQQKNWMRRHGKRGVSVFLLLQVNREYLLFDWETAIRAINNYPRFELILSALHHWSNRIDYNELKKELLK